MPVTFLQDLEVRSVHDPYGLGAMSTVQIMESHSKHNEPMQQRILLVQTPYDRQLSTMGVEVLYGKQCAWRLSSMIRLKLGGICSDLQAASVANIVYEASGVICAGVDVFTCHKGCCSVWVRTEDEAQKIRSMVHHRVWMGPLSLGFAVRAKNALSVEFLEEELHKQVKSRSEHYPRHLMTVEKYIVYDKE